MFLEAEQPFDDFLSGLGMTYMLIALAALFLGVIPGWIAISCSERWAERIASPSEDPERAKADLVLSAGAMILGLYFCVLGVVYLIGGGAIAAVGALVGEVDDAMDYLQIQTMAYGVVYAAGGVLTFRWGRALSLRAA